MTRRAWIACCASRFAARPDRVQASAPGVAEKAPWAPATPRTRAALRRPRAMRRGPTDAPRGTWNRWSWLRPTASCVASATFERGLFCLWWSADKACSAPYSARSGLNRSGRRTRAVKSEVLDPPRSGRPVGRCTPAAAVHSSPSRQKHASAAKSSASIRNRRRCRRPAGGLRRSCAGPPVRRATLGSSSRRRGRRRPRTQLRRLLIDEAIAVGGSFPISCTPEATREQVESCYPQIKSFLAQQRRLDGAGRLANAWLRHHLSLLGRETCEVRWTA